MVGVSALEEQHAVEPALIAEPGRQMASPARSIGLHVTADPGDQVAVGVFAAVASPWAMMAETLPSKRSEYSRPARSGRCLMASRSAARTEAGAPGVADPDFGDRFKQIEVIRWGVIRDGRRSGDQSWHVLIIP